MSATRQLGLVTASRPLHFPVIHPMQLELGWGGGDSFLLSIRVYLFLECKLFHVNQTNLFMLRPPPKARWALLPSPEHPNLPHRFLPRSNPGPCGLVFTWDCHGAGERIAGALGFPMHARFPPVARTTHGESGLCLPPAPRHLGDGREGPLRLQR